MSRISRAVQTVHQMDDMAGRDTWLNHMHPLAKLIVTVWYIVMVVSFKKYDLAGLLSMSLYWISMMMLGDISILQALTRVKAVLLLVSVVGIANPFVDHTVLFMAGGLPVTGGLVSMFTLMCKGGFAVLASYLFIGTTSIEEICYALRCLHIPRLIVTLVLLIYRYIILLLKEAERISQAYALRAPKQRGIHYRAWGALAGQLLLRSIARGETVYESMSLRGFQGEFYPAKETGFSKSSIWYGLLVCAVLLLLRIFPVFWLAGRLVTSIAGII